MSKWRHIWPKGRGRYVTCQRCGLTKGNGHRAKEPCAESCEARAIETCLGLRGYIGSGAHAQDVRERNSR